MILITGGTGYIGSHTAVELMQAGLDVLIVDNFCNSKATVLERIGRIAGRVPGFVEADVRDRDAMRALFPGIASKRCPFCRPEGGGRIRGSAVALLRQQYPRQSGAV